MSKPIKKKRGQSPTQGKGQRATLSRESLASQQTPTPETRRTGKALLSRKAVLALLALILLVYGQSLFFEFVDWDDNINVYENPYLLSLSREGLSRFWKAPYASLYAPLVYTSYFCELLLSDLVLTLARRVFPTANETKTFFQLASSVIHLNNLLLHWVAAVCVYRLVRRALAVSTGVALAAAAVFAVHPLQVESVVWATGRKDLLCWSLLFVALDFFASAILKDSSKVRALSIGTLFYLLALFSKPTAVITPVLAAVIAWYFQNRDRRIWLAIALWFCIALGAYAIHKSPQSDLTDAPFLIAWWKRPFLAADNLLFYLRKVVLPVGLIPIYPRKIADVFHSPLVWLALPSFVVLVFLVRHSRQLLLGIAFVVIPVAPVLGFVPFIFQFFSVVADRYFYGSMAGVALLVAHGISLFNQHRNRFPHLFTRLTKTLAALCFLALCVGAFAQSRHWRSSESLWRRELACFPTCVHALYNLASRLAEQGQLKEAISMYERILVVDPYYAAAYTNLILLNDKLGRRDEVQMYATAALELPPNCAENFLARGHGFLALGKAAEAVESFRAAIHGLPEDAPAHNSLGMAYLALGDREHAEEAFRRAVELNPALIPARLNLGDLLQKHGDLEGAKAQYEDILKIEPTNSDATRRLQRLASQSGK